MPNVLITEGAQMVSGGGEVYPATVLIGDGATVYKKGQFVYNAAGVATPVATGAGVVDTNDAGFSAAREHYIILEDSAATTGEVKVQRITEDTRFWADVVDASASDVTMASTDLGTSVQLYQEGTTYKIAVNNATSDPVAVITSVESVDYPWADDSLGKDSGGTRHSKVEFKILSTLVL